MIMKVMSSVTLFSTAVITALWLCVFLHIQLICCSHWMLKSLNLWARPIRNVFIFTHIMKCYNHTQLRLMGWVEHKDCIVFNMRWRVECWLNCENVKSILSRSSQLFEGWLLFYIERVIFLMKMIMFNSIQVTNYWFTLHCALRPLYQ